MLKFGNIISESRLRTNKETITANVEDHRLGSALSASIYS